MRARYFLVQRRLNQSICVELLLPPFPGTGTSSFRVSRMRALVPLVFLAMAVRADYIIQTLYAGEGCTGAIVGAAVDFPALCNYFDGYSSEAIRCASPFPYRAVYQTRDCTGSFTTESYPVVFGCYGTSSVSCITSSSPYSPPGSGLVVRYANSDATCPFVGANTNLVAVQSTDVCIPLPLPQVGFASNRITCSSTTAFIETWDNTCVWKDRKSVV